MRRDVPDDLLPDDPRLMEEHEAKLVTSFLTRPVYVPRFAWCKACQNRVRRGFVMGVRWLKIEPWVHVIAEHQDDHEVISVVFEPPLPPTIVNPR